MPISLPSISTIFDLIKAGATLEAREAIMKLREGALLLQEDNLKLSQENRELRNDIEKLTKDLTFKKSLKFVHSAYYADGDKVPFCPTCYEKEGKAIHLPMFRSDGGARCNACNSYTKFRHSEITTVFSG